jgi:endonuclease-3 related protein
MNLEPADARRRLRAIYRALYRAGGPQRWWPAETRFEVMVGAVLTQNTAWTNVEKAIENLRQKRLLTPARLAGTPLRTLAGLIRPSGYYNIKAKRLRNLVGLITDRYSGSLEKMFARGPAGLREELLEVNGIGPETADSILLYAGNMPFFVVDAYTKRIFSRHGFIPADADYHQVQKLFMDSLPRSTRLYNEYHALIVRLGKEYCRKKTPLCETCPLKPFLTSRKTATSPAATIHI